MPRRRRSTTELELAPQRASSLRPPARLAPDERNLLGGVGEYVRSHVDALETHRHSAHDASIAESLEDFPDASFADRRPPFISDQAQTVLAQFGDDMTQVHVSGNLLAVPCGHEIHFWNAGTGEGDVFQDSIVWTISALGISATERYVWAGTVKGKLFEVEVEGWTRSASTSRIHNFRIIAIFRLVDVTFTLDESGKLVVWLPDPASGTLCSLNGPYKELAIPPRPTWYHEIDGRIWTFYASDRKNQPTLGPGVLRVFDIEPSGNRLHETTWTADMTPAPVAFGRVTCGGVVPAQPGFVFLGHDTGHVTVWDRANVKLQSVQKVSLEGITAMAGPSRYLWVGFSTGCISVFDVSTTPWRVIKHWQAHQGKVTKISLDPASVWSAECLRVVSAGEDNTIHFWDGFLRSDWIRATLRAREPTFCVRRNLNVNMFSWNVDGEDPIQLQTGPQNQTLLAKFLASQEEPDVLHFGFQEMIDLSDKTLAARTLLFASDNHDVTGRYREWRRVLKAAINQHLGPDYVLVKHQHMVGLASDLYMRRSIAARARDVAVCTVKTGMLEQEYGNKGSIMIRFVLDDSSLCFINNHLASGQKRPTERTRDIIEILETKSHFPRPSSATRLAYVSRGGGTQVADHELAFFAGDLNFRIDLPRQVVISSVAAHQLATLLPHDQLRLELAHNPSFRLRSFLEPPIVFDPTYKYDHHTRTYDTSKKQRVPSWCDRILYRSEPRSKIEPVAYLRYEADISDHRPISGAFVVQIKTVVPAARETVWRQVVRDWSVVQEELLETARSYYPMMAMG